MALRFSSALIVLLLLVSCSSPMQPGAAEATVEPTPTPAPSATDEPDGSTPYDYDAPIPTRPKPLADDLITLSSDLHAEIAGWVDGGTEPGPEARPVLLRAVRHQRIYRNLLDHPRLYAKVR